MATTKATTTAKAAEKKVEAKAVETKTTATKATATTATAAKAPAKKAETKTAAKAPAKKAPAKKAAAKKESNLYVEFAGKQVDVETVKANAIADYKTKSGKKTAPASVKIYVKPEDGKAYYVIDDVFGDVAL